MEERGVREQLEEVFDAAREIDWEDPLPSVESFERVGMMTSDDGALLRYPDGSAFALHVVCVARPAEPNEEAV